MNFREKKTKLKLKRVNKGAFKYYISRLGGGGGLFQVDDCVYYAQREGGSGVKMITNDYYI